MSNTNFDFDQIIIGSGFGGAASALRLTEKGFRVLVLERGKRIRTKEFSRTSWNLKRFMWLPQLGLTGPFTLSITRKINLVHGSAVGGGSLVYGNTHLIPGPEIFAHPSWTGMHEDWHARLSPYYALAQRMIGVQQNRFFGPADLILKDVAKEMGRENTFKTVYSGLLYPKGENKVSQNINVERLGEDRGDPYFNGDGPKRNSCTYCGNCMSGCRHNAKNSLDKNYLYFAERNGAEIRPESNVTKIEPIADENGVKDGSAGYTIHVTEGLGLFNKKKYTLTTRGVVVSGGVFGTMPLLLRMRDVEKTLPNLSPNLGQNVLTNSETLLTVSHNRLTQQEQKEEVWNGTAITSIFSPDDETKVEVVRYAKGSDAAFTGGMSVPLTSKQSGIPRSVSMLINIAKQPIKTLKMANPVGKAKDTIILLVMQTAQNNIHLESKRAWYSPFKPTWIPVQHKGDEKLRNYFPIAHKVAEHYVKRSGGDAGNLALEVIVGTPITAHMMGGAIMGKDPKTAVLDDTGQTYAYKNLRILDGSIIAGNLGVNPSLTILALTEHAMAQIPVFDTERAAKIKPIHFSAALDGNPSAIQAAGMPEILTKAV
ncbi:GMC family oxidoreductase [Moritella sp. 5]|uniref:GMC oxidoreductase n=1 Tax=Moritella sp. 5 TaxID=2746231 RepID=UPI001BA82977|nr:GMC family oxidoreductase [Moritella sp. 5]QUM81313.1 GMC family oxidoreductase [Moritella sp. 5]